MTPREVLPDPPGRLAAQPDGSQGRERGRSWLAVESAGRGFLLPLNEAGEIFPFRTCVAVPHAKPWFLGVANLRGQLQGVVDLARFLELDGAAGPTTGGWLVALNPRFEVNAALRVDRLAGLRREDQLRPLDPLLEGSPDSSRPGFAGAVYADRSGSSQWQEIRLVELAGEPHFLDIARAL